MIIISILLACHPRFYPNRLSRNMSDVVSGALNSFEIVVCSQLLNWTPNKCWTAKS